MSEAETRDISDALDRLSQRIEGGGKILDERFEDGHSAIESWLVEQVGDTGKRVHTGRSRNDQVLVATRLYIRASLDEQSAACERIVRKCLERAEAHSDWPMPGYTHLQRAMVSSVGMWFAGWAEAFLDNLELLRSTARWIDANPLGTAAGYGVNLALDRAYTTERLAFSRVQVNPIYAQGSRGKYELQVLSTVAQLLLDIRRLAWDLSLFTTQEFALVRLPDAYTTGSSLMPNKRNPDVVELLRGAYSSVAGAISELQSLPLPPHRLPS